MLLAWKGLCHALVLALSAAGAQDELEIVSATTE